MFAMSDIDTEAMTPRGLQTLLYLVQFLLAEIDRIVLDRSPTDVSILQRIFV